MPDVHGHTEINASQKSRRFGNLISVCPWVGNQSEAMQAPRALWLLTVAAFLETSMANATGLFDGGLVVTDQAMGARCAVAADFDGDGRLDLVSASSNDNAVSWFRNEMDSSGTLSFSMKKQITWSSLGSRIVTVADIDMDCDVDMMGVSYYDSTVRWYEKDWAGKFTPRIISTAAHCPLLDSPSVPCVLPGAVLAGPCPAVHWREVVCQSKISARCVVKNRKILLGVFKVWYKREHAYSTNENRFHREKKRCSSSIDQCK